MIANVCLTAGPAVEIVVCRLGLRARVLTPLLFATGLLVSVPFVLVYILGAFRWTIG